MSSVFWALVSLIISIDGKKNEIKLYISFNYKFRPLPTHIYIYIYIYIYIFKISTLS